jgi:hypothetical protein
MWRRSPIARRFPNRPHPAELVSPQRRPWRVSRSMNDRSRRRGGRFRRDTIERSRSASGLDAERRGLIAMPIDPPH